MSKTIVADIRINMDVMERVASQEGFLVEKNIPVRGYYGNLQTCSLVVSKDTRYSIGFSADKYGNTVAVYDDMYKNTANKLLATYKTVTIQESLESAGMLVSKSKVGSKVILTTRRR